jgi:hypothetical protein
VIRNTFPETLIFGVHLTGISDEEARNFVNECDVVAACASQSVRKVVGKLKANVAIAAAVVFPIPGNVMRIEISDGRDLLQREIKMGRKLSECYINSLWPYHQIYQKVCPNISSSIFS